MKDPTCTTHRPATGAADDDTTPCVANAENAHGLNRSAYLIGHRS